MHNRLMLQPSLRSLCYGHAPEYHPRGREKNNFKNRCSKNSTASFRLNSLEFVRIIPLLQNL